MRIVAGKYKGHQLKRVFKETTRETADMVREAVFNMLFDVHDCVVLDLFAGSGAYAFESLSRDAKFAYLVDQDRHAIKTIAENAKNLKLDQFVRIYKTNYERFLENLNEDMCFDLVFLDPPYEMKVYEQIIHSLVQYTKTDSRIVCEAEKNYVFLENIDTFEKLKEKVYGNKKICIYMKK